LDWVLEDLCQAIGRGEISGGVVTHVASELAQSSDKALDIDGTKGLSGIGDDPSLI